MRSSRSSGAARDDGLRRLSRLTWRATQLSAITAVGFAILFARTAVTHTASAPKPVARPSPHASPGPGRNAAQVRRRPGRHAAAAPAAPGGTPAPAPAPSAAPGPTHTLAPPPTTPAPAPTPAPTHSTTSGSTPSGG